MQYMLLIYGDDAEWENASPEVRSAEYERHRQFGQRVAGLGGKIIGGAELKSTSLAKTVRGDLVTDGPFLDTKEALGGYYIIETSDHDQIVAIARECPSSGGVVEIRQLNE
jgi:hypothetical protein